MVSSVESFFVHSTEDPTLWRVISVWRSREALDEYRRSVETPGGVLMFRAAGAEPAVRLRRGRPLRRAVSHE
jgi:hypothetical protein